MFLRLRSFLIIAAVAFLALISASCGESLSATEALAASGEKFEQLDSFQVRVESTAKGEESTFRSEFTDVYDHGELVYAQSTGRMDGQDSFETLLVPPDFYMRTSGGQWYVLSPWHQGTRPNEIPDLSLKDEFLDYREMLDDLDGVERLSDEKVDGRKYMHFTGTIALRDIDEAADDLGLADGVFDVELWVDDETKLPDRMEVTGELIADDVDIVTETNFEFEYDQAIEIPPVPTDTLPWRDLQYPDAPCTGSDFERCLAAQTDLEPLASSSCDGPGRRICLAPVGQIDASLVPQLVDYYRAQYGLNVTILTPLSAPEDAADPKRQQVDAAALIGYFGAHFPAAYSDPEAVLIGITPVDLYNSESHFRYVFGIKRSAADPRAVISTFRMTPEFYGLPADPDLVASRTRKLLTKYIGLLYYDLPPSDDPTSPMFDSILGPDDLDAMGEPLPTSQ